ncbi:MAG: hypothetical protein ITG02_01880 [Patulibacter sp.]|nr:hypothetical protein [Patulibacter sp.]
MVTAAAVVLVAIAFVAHEATKQVIAKEYDSWAPALARALTRLAGAIHSPRAKEWIADLVHVQAEPGQSGLWEACQHILAAPKLTGIATARRITGSPGIVADVDMAPASPEQFARWIAGWIRERDDNAGVPDHLAQTVYEFGSMLAHAPQIVSFIAESDGDLRGVHVQGLEDEGVAVSARFHALNPGLLDGFQGDVLIADPELLDALWGLASTTANFHCEDLRDDESIFRVAYCGFGVEPTFGSFGATTDSWGFTRVERGDGLVERRLILEHGGDGTVRRGRGPAFSRSILEH